MMRRPAHDVIRCVVLWALVMLMVGCTTCDRHKATSCSSRLAIPRVDLPVTMDGKIAEGFWKEAALVSAFSTIEGTWALRQTVAHIAHDGTTLFLAYVCTADAGFKPHVKVRDNDNRKIFKDDSVEFFVDANGDRDSYVHLAFNAMGAHYSALCGVNPRKRRDAAWNPEGMQVAVSRSESSWYVEVAIPLASLDLDEALGKDLSIGLNFGRNVRSGRGRGVCSWTGVSDFNAPDRFGRAVFAAQPEPGIVLHNFDVTERAIQGAITIVNQASSEPSFVVSAQSGTNVFVKGISVAAGHEETVPFLIPLRDDACRLKSAAVSLALDVVQNGMSIFARERIMSGDIAGGMTRNVQMCRLDRYYYPAHTRAIHVVSKGHEAGTRRIRAAIVRSGEIVSAEFPVTSGKAEGTLDYGKSLDAGRYTLRIRVWDAEGESTAEIERVLHVLPADQPEALPAVEEIALRDGFFYVNGKPFFAYCSTLTRNFPKWLPPCFNARFGDSLIRERAPAIPVASLPWVTREAGATIFLYPEDAALFARLRKGVAREPAHRLFRRIRYEAQIPAFQKSERGRKRLELVPFYRTLNHFLKGLDPKTPTSIHGGNAKLIPAFWKAGVDVMEVSFWSSGFARDMIPCLVSDLQNAKRLCMGKPMVVWLGGSIPSPSCRIAEEMRCAIYLTMMNRVAGTVIHMEHGGVPLERMRYWSVFWGISREIDALFPIIHSREDSPALLQAGAGRDFTRSGDIVYLVRQWEGKAYLIAVNTSSGRTRATFALDPTRLGDGDPVEALFENRTVRLSNGVIEDTFHGYEPHVYVLPLK